MKKSFTILLANVLVLVIGFCIDILIARRLGANGKGYITSILVIPMLLVTFCELGIRQSVVYFTNKVSTDILIGNVLFIYIIISTLGIGFSIFLNYIFISNLSILLNILSSLFIPLLLVRSYSSGFLLGNESIKLFSLFIWLPSFINLFLLYILSYRFNTGIMGILICNILGSVISAYFSINHLINKYRLSININYNLIKKLIVLGVKFAFSVFILNLNYKFDLILIDKYLTKSDVGIYSVGVKFAELIWQLPTAIGLLVFSKSSNSKDSNYFSYEVVKMLKYVLIISIFIGFVYLFFIDKIILIMYGSDFLKSSIVCIYLLPGVILSVSFKLLNFDLAGRGRPLIALYAAIPSLIINIIFNIILIPKIGYVGAAISSSISYSILSILFIFVYKRAIISE